MGNICFWLTRDWWIYPTGVIFSWHKHKCMYWYLIFLQTPDTIFTYHLLTYPPKYVISFWHYAFMTDWGKVVAFQVRRLPSQWPQFERLCFSICKCETTGDFLSGDNFQTKKKTKNKKVWREVRISAVSVVAKVGILITLPNHVFEKLCLGIGRCLGNIEQVANLVSSGTGPGAMELQPVEEGKIQAQEMEESAFFQNEKKKWKTSCA